MSQRDVLQYVHHNRNNNARQINTIGKAKKIPSKLEVAPPPKCGVGDG